MEAVHMTSHFTVTGSYRRWFWLVAVLGFAADQLSKYGVYAAVTPGTERLVDLSFLTLSVIPLPYDMLNTGALGGVGKQLGKSSNWILAGVSGVAIGVIVIWSLRPAFAASRFLCLAVGLLLAGAAGNLYDRLVFYGVRDFLQLWYGDRRVPLTYIFNLADFWLICGTALLLLQACFSRSEQSAAAPANAPANVTPPDAA
jgi:signal peptidase II